MSNNNTSQKHTSIYLIKKAIDEFVEANNYTVKYKDNPLQNNWLFFSITVPSSNVYRYKVELSCSHVIKSIVDQIEKSISYREKRIETMQRNAKLRSLATSTITAVVKSIMSKYSYYWSLYEVSAQELLLKIDYDKGNSLTFSFRKDSFMKHVKTLEQDVCTLLQFVAEHPTIHFQIEHQNSKLSQKKYPIANSR